MHINHHFNFFFIYLTKNILNFLEQAKEQALTENASLEDGFSTFEMRQSRRGTLASKRGTMRSTTTRRSSNLAMINTRAPPRPTPSMVNYSDEDSAKGYDENPDDSDSLTEKPSEISSTDSQVCFFFSSLAHLLVQIPRHNLLKSFIFSFTLFLG